MEKKKTVIVAIRRMDDGNQDSRDHILNGRTDLRYVLDGLDVGHEGMRRSKDTL